MTRKSTWNYVAQMRFLECPAQASGKVNLSQIKFIFTIFKDLAV